MFEALGNLGDFVGGAAVVLTLIYLATQVRQNTRTSLAATELQVGQMAVSFNTLVAANPDLARIYRVGLTGSESLTPDEGVRWLSLLAVIFYSYEALFRQFERGLLDEESWRSVEQGIETHLRSEAVARWWRNRAAVFSESFTKLVDSKVANL